ncbi:MAG: adenylate/guanylate cyclase domain-containing protein [Bdellovibrionota bacterium]
MKENRHLAAIFFSDMVGYTAASHKNEDLALELLEEHRAILRPLIAKYEGREIKTMGDGFLVEFGNARSATLCAVEAQQAHTARNESVGPDRQVQIRIGIHIGDVVESADHDVYGDGVNIAARLMQVARPGRICISSPVMDQVRSSTDRWVTKIGAQKLKGITRNITAFIIYPEYSKDEIPPFVARFKVKANRHKTLVRVLVSLVLLLWAGFLWGLPALRGSALMGGSPRIAVLPLKPLGLPASESYLAEGITDEIISSLSRLSVIRVLSKASSSRLAEPNSASLIPELNLSGMVEGSVVKIGQKLRIHVGLTDVKTQESLWSKDFDGNMLDTFETQKAVARAIAEQFLHIAKVKGAEAKLNQMASKSPRPNDQAYLHYLKALQLMQKRNEVGLKGSLRELESAISIDPNFSYAHALAANVYGLLNFYGYIKPEEAIERGQTLASRALEIEPENPEALLWFAENYAYIKHEWTKAFEFYDRAIKSNPNIAKSYQWYGEALVSNGRLADARKNYTKARELDPLSPIVLVASAEPDFFSGEFDRAIATYRRASEIDPESMLPYLWQGRAWLAKKNYAKALENFQKAETYSERSSLIEAFQIDAIYLLGNKGEAQQKMKGLLDRAELEHVSHYALAHVYLTFGYEDKALSELEIALRLKESQVVFLKVDPIFMPLRQNPAFLLLLREMALSN